MSFFEDIFMSAPIGLTLNDFDGTFKHANLHVQNLLGYSENELISLNYNMLLPDTYKDGQKKKIEALKKDKHYGPYHEQYIHKNGHLIDVLLSSVLVDDEKGGQLISTSIQDVTQSKNAQRVLNKAQEMGNIGHWSLDLLQNKLEWSDETYRIFGLKPQEFEASYDAFVEHIFPDDRDAVNTAYSHSLEVDKPYQIEHRVIRPDGSVRYVIERCEHNHDSTGAIIGSIGTVLDVTDLQEKEEALIQAKEKAESANHAKSLFIASMSHELRTPLNAILGFSQNMSSATNLNETQHKHLEIINTSGENLLTMINEILDMSKIESGEMKISNAPFSIEHLITSISNLLKAEAENKSLECSVTMDPNLPEFINSDEGKLRQILINIISNAIKFTDQGYVKLSLASQRDAKNSSQVKLIIKVEDSGCGIQKEMQDDIFKPFVQNDGLKKVEGGTGLGLAITQKLITLLGGSVSLQSDVEKGSTFIIEFQAEIAGSFSSNTIDKARKIIAIEPTKNNKLLIVDDIATNRILLSVLFKDLGFEIKEASSGKEAIEIFKKWPADFIWMDIEMPHLNGYETTKLIRKEPQGQDVKVAALSASVLDDSSRREYESVCDYFVARPFSNKEIFDTVQKALDITYVYEEKETKEQDSANTKASPAKFSPDMLLDIDTKIINPIIQAAEKGSGIKVKKSLEAIKDDHSALYDYLFTLAQAYEFEKIVTLLKVKDD